MFPFADSVSLESMEEEEKEAKMEEKNTTRKSVEKGNDNGDKYWFKDRSHHRLDGPAIEYGNGNKVWYNMDKLHRLDGPALKNVSGYNTYNMDSEIEFNNR
jgi:hypothetical protein